MNKENSNKIKQLANREIAELSPEELAELNYERKVRDQQAANRKITARHINIAAVTMCLIVLFYAIPRMIWFSKEEQRAYVPLSERADAERIEILPPLPQDPELPAPQTRADAPPDMAPDLPAGEARAPTETAPKPATPDLAAEIRAMVEQWASDWAAQNVGAYLSHYASSFVSDSGQDLTRWREYRRSRVLSPEWIEIDLREIEVEFEANDRAYAQFLQAYSSSNYTEESWKRLVLVRENGRWKIYRELSTD